LRFPARDHREPSNSHRRLTSSYAYPFGPALERRSIGAGLPCPRKANCEFRRKAGAERQSGKSAIGAAESDTNVSAVSVNSEYEPDNPVAFKVIAEQFMKDTLGIALIAQGSEGQWRRLVGHITSPAGASSGACS
jgi:hypothetical protein